MAKDVHSVPEAAYDETRSLLLELLRQGDISAGRAARLLNISRWDLSDLMYEAGISPFDDSLTTEALDAEVKSALTEISMNLNHEGRYK